MKARMLSLLAGVAMFGAASAANAVEPILLTDGTLDKICAGNVLGTLSPQGYSSSSSAAGAGVGHTQAAVYSGGASTLFDGNSTATIPSGTIVFSQGQGS